MGDRIDTLKRLQFLVALLIAVSAQATEVPRATQAARGEAASGSCRPGTLTRLALSCGNAWNTATAAPAPSSSQGQANQLVMSLLSQKRRTAAAAPAALNIAQEAQTLHQLNGTELFVDDPNAFNPWATGPDSGSTRRQVLTYNRCPQLQIVSVAENDRMARVRCQGEGALRGEFWINLAFLSCSPDHASPIFAPSGSAECSRDAGAPAPKCDSDPAGAQPATDAVGRRFVENAKTIAREAQADIQADTELLINRYKSPSVTDGELYRRLKRAHDRLSADFRVVSRRFGPDCMRNSQNTQGQRTCRLLRAAYLLSERYFTSANIAIKSALAQNAEDSKGDPDAARWIQQTYEQSGGSDAIGGRQLRLEWSEIMGTPLALATSSDFGGTGNAYVQGNTASDMPMLTPEGRFEEGQQADLDRRRAGLIPAEYQTLAFRQLLLMGMPNAEQAQVTGKGSRETLRFVRDSRESGVHIQELHNGYVWGGTSRGNAGKFELDCSHFLAAVIGGSESGAPNTGALRDVAACLEGERHGQPCRRGGMARCFELVDLQGDHPRPGDIVISRNDSVEQGGHVVVVDRFNCQTKEIETVEACGGRCSTFTSQHRPIYEPQCGDAAGPNVPRSDIWALRYAEKQGCTLDLMNAGAETASREMPGREPASAGARAD